MTKEPLDLQPNRNACRDKNTPSREELLPCPFCGRQGSLAEFPDDATPYSRVACLNTACRVIVNVARPTTTEAVNAWNARAQSIGRATLPETLRQAISLLKIRLRKSTLLMERPDNFGKKRHKFTCRKNWEAMAESIELMEQYLAAPTDQQPLQDEALREALTEQLREEHKRAKKAAASAYDELDQQHWEGCRTAYRHVLSMLDEMPALSSPMQTIGEWQPIETAPKDGTRILGLDETTDTMHVTSHDQYAWHNPDEHYYSETPDFNPTLWLPITLPTPPKGE